MGKVSLSILCVRDETSTYHHQQGDYGFINAKSKDLKPQGEQQGSQEY
jgi:hypothetical protein